jgi:hypothetical protein
MRTFKFISIIFIATFFSSFKSRTNQVVINGHLRKNPSDTFAPISHLIVFVKGDNKVLAKTTTDEKGDFSLSFTPGKEISFDFFCNGVGVDTMLIACVTKFESDTPDMTFYIPGNYKTNDKGKVICSKCKRANKVYKISYGDGPISMRHINGNGDTSYSPLYKGTYQEDCMERPAKYYCDRDKIKF